MADLIPPDLTGLDRVALGWFVLAWLGYGQFIHQLRSPRSITWRLRGIRRAWMHTMLGRDNRMTDAALIGHVVHSTTFFASTTMVALAALLGVLAGFDHGFSTLMELAFTAKTSRALAEAKLLLLVVVFAHTFLKLTWAIRQLNYSVALLGAAPVKLRPGQRDAVADHVAAVLSLTVSSFNAGIRGYYFALAALAWLLGPGAFALVTTGIVAMLLWRQFGSETADEIRLSHVALMGEAAEMDERGHPVARGLCGKQEA